MSESDANAGLAASPGSEFVPIPDRYNPFATEGWRCFHCDMKFHTVDDAQAHFGPHGAIPACQIDAVKLREMEEELRRYRGEDTDLHRQIAEMMARHSRDLQRAEELGYSRGLRDGLEMSPNASGSATPGGGQ